jgi:hypothetical protein
MKTKKTIIKIISLMFLFSGCNPNSVTKLQLEKIKAGDVLVYRYQKPDGKTWYFADKITRIEGDRIFYNPGKSEATASHNFHLTEFLTTIELSATKEEILKYGTEQGLEKKVIIWIK